MSSDGYIFCSNVDAAMGTRSRPERGGRGGVGDAEGVRESLRVIEEAAEWSKVIKSQAEEEEGAIRRAGVWLTCVTEGGVGDGRVEFAASTAGGQAAGRAGWRGGGVSFEAGSSDRAEGGHVVVRVAQERAGGGASVWYTSSPAGPRDWTGHVPLRVPADLSLRSRCSGNLELTSSLLLAPSRVGAANGGGTGGDIAGVVVPHGGRKIMDAFELRRAACGKISPSTPLVASAKQGSVGADARRVVRARPGKMTWMLPKGLGSGAVREGVEALEKDVVDWLGPGGGGGVPVKVCVLDDVVIRVEGAQHVCSVVEMRYTGPPRLEGGAGGGEGGGSDAAVMAWARSGLCGRMAGWVGRGGGELGWVREG